MSINQDKAFLGIATILKKQIRGIKIMLYLLRLKTKLEHSDRRSLTVTSVSDVI